MSRTISIRLFPILLFILVPAVMTAAILVGMRPTTAGPQRSSEAAAPAVQPQPDRVRFDGHKVVRANLKTSRHIMTMNAISDDPWSEGVGIGWFDFRIAPEAMPVLDRSGIEYRVIIEDLQQLIDAERERIEQFHMRLDDPGWYEEYRTNDEVNDLLDELVAERPDLAELIVIGESVEGRPIRGLRITGPGDGPKPAVLYHGCQHAREWITVMVTAWIAEKLIREYDTDDRIRNIVDAAEFYVIPVVNPDGYIHSWDVNRMWRKNRRPGNCYGVDPNRNWSVGWGGSGSSGNPCSQIYRGPSPFSEPETAALRDLMYDNPNILVHVDIHNYTQLILQPWGYTFQYPEHHDALEEIGARTLNTIFSINGMPYVHGATAETIYQASGIASDWSYGELGILGLTFELRDRGEYGFLLPADQIIPNCEEIMPAAIELAEWAVRPVSFDYHDQRPTVFEHGESATVQVTPLTPLGSIDPMNVTLYHRLAGDSTYNAVTMFQGEGNSYSAIFPEFECGEEVEYYIEVYVEGFGYVHDPADGPDDPYRAPVGYSHVLFSDQFEFDKGWTVGASDDDAVAGTWERAAPEGYIEDGEVAQPFGALVGLRCYTTGASGGKDNNVTGGKTTLLSPVFDLSELQDSAVLLSYSRWFSNHVGSYSWNQPPDVFTPYNDAFEIDISIDGGQTWTPLEHVGPASRPLGRTEGGWWQSDIRLDDFVPLTDTVQVRFVAYDYDYKSLIEAAIDDVTIRAFSCEEPCHPADLNCDGKVDGEDLGILLANWGDCDECDDCLGDINGDCTVDGADLGILLANWG